jgi:hypothetical protein
MAAVVRNQVASVSHEILEEHAEILFKKCVHMALQENVTALRLCIERLEPILLSSRRGPRSSNVRCLCGELSKIIVKD